MPTEVSLMFGGNIGDTASLFETACGKLERAGFLLLKKSSVFITPPVDCVPGTPDFLNQAVLGCWQGSPRELLLLTQRLERESGRPREHSSAEARTLDIDIITFGELVLEEPDLILPHPRAQQRLFVLEPLGEIAPELRFPDSGKSVSQLLTELKN